MSDRDVIEADIIEIVQNKSGRPELPVSGDSKLLDLGLESLDIVEVVFEIEERWGIELPFSANSAGAFDMDTVGDVIDKVRELLPDA